MVMLDIFLAPNNVFEKIKQIKKWSWLALLILLVATISSIVGFYSNMSSDWLMEQQLLHAGEIAPSEKEVVMDMMAQTIEYIGLIGSVFSSIFLIFICVASAGYLVLVSKFSDNERDFQFGDWFGFSVWSQMPVLINLLGFVFLYATSATPDLPLVLPNYASINQLFLGLVPGDSFFNLAENVNLFYLWSIGLVAYGLNYCCNMSLLKATFFSLLPYLVVFGLWSLILI
jgi:hypothetical protein